MAQSLFDALTGVSLDSSAVQSLLESQTLITEVEHSAIDQDDDDIFQCGKCKCQFTSLHLFLLHKREHLKPPEETVDLSQYLVPNSVEAPPHPEDPCQQPQYNPEGTFIQTDQLTEPIILEETDMLFSMDQEGAYLTSDTGFGVPIILSAENLETFHQSTSDNLLKDEQMLTEATTLNNLNQMEPETVPTEAPADPQLDQNEAPEDPENPSTSPQNFKYKCNYCNKQFAKKFYWQQHERSHTGEKPYQCVVCGRAFAQKSNVKKHMSSHKVWPGTAIHSLPPEAPPDGNIDRTYHCQFCKEIFDSYKALKAHLIVSHMTLKVYKCVQSSCSMMFAELDDFLEHTRSHKRSEYRCHVCGQVFNTLSDLGLHQYVHSVQKQKTTEKYYCCTVCKSSFSNLEALQHHTETTTHDYACPHCGKSFLIERFLRRHLKTHVSSARFACEDCGKAFKTEQYLANHKLIHSEETPYSCSQCPARFKRKDRLGRHMLIHDLTKRLKCPFRGYLGCMSEFSRPDKLKRHLLTHSNIKRFSCGHCNRNFPRAQALKHHEISKHSLKCDSCSHTFKCKDQLVTHNCDQSGETKKHSTSQLPKKASGTFKPRKPTPKRQLPQKSSAGVGDKEKPSPEPLRLSYTEEESSSERVPADNFSITREIGSTIEALMQSDCPEEHIRSDIDFQAIQQHSSAE
ncbi:zinc finger protein 341 isoform X2 [Diachasma alloeum]|uniref:zinc finger protein 341 isoform X2 n=1 Tax=Diachasma alloeum TaxID=454923 RepID=UPI0007383B45|nr:zinc finger protein 341 isoform X2 [Diachasma alloeum]